jgi:diguanylate cyclase (GGDEF)-like protein
MALDNLTLLFSLALLSGLFAIGLALTSRRGQRDGLLLWAIALAFESVGWTLAACRGAMPVLLSVMLANLSLVASQSVKLAAIHEYRGLSWPRWQCGLPLLAMLLLLLALSPDDFRGRIIYGSLIYAVQMLMMARALRADFASRGGRAWKLLFGATVAILPILVLRFAMAAWGGVTFTPPQVSYAPSAVQLVVFVGVVALDLLGALGFILLVKERTDRAIRLLAMTDGLTGISNRRAFMERAEQELALAKRNQMPLSLLMFDVDHFKRINDEHGHASGDAVLVEITRRIAGRLRKQDTFGRYGGEEFCILLPATDEAGAMLLSEQLRQAIELEALTVGQTAIPVTISIGVTVCNARCASCPLDFSQLLGNADRALYQGKAAGRNRTIILPPGCDGMAYPALAVPGVA